MKKIVFSAALTAVVGWAAFQLVGKQQAIPETNHLAKTTVTTMVTESVSGEKSSQATLPTDWKTVVAGAKDPRLAKQEPALKDPIGAFQRWADEFMAGTGGELEGLRLAKARRVEMTRLIRENPAQAIANRVDPDMRESLPQSIRETLEQPVSGRGNFESLSISRLAKSSRLADVGAEHGSDSHTQWPSVHSPHLRIVAWSELAREHAFQRHLFGWSYCIG
jgi:hypothetical protein